MAERRKLHIAKTSSWRHAYELREGKRILATLDLENRHGSAATLRAGDVRVTVHRTKFHPKEIELEHENGENAVFRARWNAKGMLELNGKRYFWRPANRMWTAWKWENEEGGELLRLSYRGFRPFLVSGSVHADPGVSENELGYLALFGWYLILLDLEITGSHILNALDLTLRRFKKPRVAV